MSKELTPAEREKRVAEVRRWIADGNLVTPNESAEFLLAEIDRLQQERDVALADVKYWSGAFSDLATHEVEWTNRGKDAEAELAKEREKITEHNSAIKLMIGWRQRVPFTLVQDSEVDAWIKENVLIVSKLHSSEEKP